MFNLKKTHKNEFLFICYINNRKSSSRENRKQLSVQQSLQSNDGPQSILKAKSML